MVGETEKKSSHLTWDAHDYLTFLSSHVFLEVLHQRWWRLPFFFIPPFCSFYFIFLKSELTITISGLFRQWNGFDVKTSFFKIKFSFSMTNYVLYIDRRVFCPLQGSNLPFPEKRALLFFFFVQVKSAPIV
jgi:hypothetical protein